MTDVSGLRFENPGSVAPPLGAYSHVAVVPEGSALIAFAGQVGNAPDGSIPESAEAQYENALRNIVRLLDSEGCTPAHLVKLNSYLVRRMDLPTVAATRKAVLGDVRPAATMVYVAALAAPEYLVEVEAWALRSTTRQA